MKPSFTDFLETIQVKKKNKTGINTSMLCNTLQCFNLHPKDIV